MATFDSNSVFFIDSSTNFKLSATVSAGQIKVPSEWYFKAASPYFPEVIAFLRFSVI